MKRLLIGVFGLAMLLGATTWVWAENNPVIGTWTINLAKSTYHPAALAPKRTTVTNTAVGDAIRTLVDVVDARGKAYHYEYTVKLDGKDVLVTGDPNRELTQIKKIENTTTD